MFILKYVLSVISIMFSTFGVLHYMFISPVWAGIFAFITMTLITNFYYLCTSTIIIVEREK